MLVAKYARTDAQPAMEKVGLQARELSPSTILVGVSGEIDASTESSLLDGIVTNLHRHRQLVLDLSQVRFFGTAGYSALHRLHSHCARAASAWGYARRTSSTAAGRARPSCRASRTARGGS